MAGPLPPPPLNGPAIKGRTFFAASLIKNDKSDKELFFFDKWPDVRPINVRSVGGPHLYLSPHLDVYIRYMYISLHRYIQWT